MGILKRNGMPSCRRWVVQLAGCLSCGLLALFAIEPGPRMIEAVEEKGGIIVPCGVVCPADIIFAAESCGSSVSFNYPRPTFTGDDCRGVTFSYSPPPGTFFTFGTHTVTCTTSEGATCTFNVIITGPPGDLTAPVITCSANITVSTAPGTDSALVNYQITATDNCTPTPYLVQTAGLPSGSLFPVGTVTNSWQATDANGNSSTCQFTVRVIDMEPPVTTCPADIVVSNDSGVLGAIVNYDAVTAMDNVDFQFSTITQLEGLPSGSLFPVGETTQTWQAEDSAGNTAQCSFKVIVIAPAITVKKPNNSIVFQGVKTPVRWNSKGDPGNVRIELRRDGEFVRIIKASTQNDGKLKWRVPANLPVGNGYTVRIGSIDFPGIFDDNNKPFRVKSLD